MAEKIGSIFWQVTVDNSQAKQQLRETRGDFDKAGESVHKTNKATALLKAGLVAAGAAAYSFGRASVNAYFESEKAHTKLVTNLKVLKTNTDQNAVSLEKLAAKMQKVGVIEDDVIIAGMSQLATFKLQSKTIETLTPKIADMVAQLKGHNATAEDTVNINNLVGKVMYGNVGALSRYGIVLDENQKKIIKDGTESQRAATLVDVLSQNYGKVNEALGKTPQGKITQLKNAFGDLQESVGAALVNTALPAMDALGGSSGDVMGLLKALTETVGEVGASTIKALTPVLGVIKPLLPLLKGISTVAGAIPPTFFQVAIGAALLSRGLDRVTLPTKGVTAALQQHQNALGNTDKGWKSWAASLLHTGDNIQNVGLHMKGMSGITDNTGGRFKTTMASMAASAKSAGSSIVSALGGPMGIGLMVGVAAFTQIKSSMDKAKASAKQLKEEAKDVSQELRFSKVTRTGSDQVELILDRLKEKGGEASKAIKTLNKDISENLSEIVGSQAAYNSKINSLSSKANAMDDKGLSGGVNRTIGNMFGTKDAEKDAAKQKTNLQKVRDAVVETQKDILISNKNLAKDLGRNDLAKIFSKQATVVEKDVGKAYMGAAKATSELDREQKNVTDQAERVALGLDKASKSVSKNSDAMLDGAKSASELFVKLTGVAQSTMRVASDQALKGVSPERMAQASSEYLGLAKTNVDKANEYALQFADSLGVDPEEADKVAQSLIDFGTKTQSTYLNLLEGIKSSGITLDKAYAEKLEIKPGGPSAAQLLKNVQTINGMNAKFYADVKAIDDAGYHNLAADLSQRGVETAGLSAASVLDGIKKGNTKNAALLDTEIKNNTAFIEKKITDENDRLSRNIAAKSFIINPKFTVKPTFGADAVKSPVWKVKGLTDGKESSSNAFQFSFLPEQKEKGGPVKGGNPYIVGERGRELFVPNGDGSIMTASNTSKMLQQAPSQLSGGTTNVTLKMQFDGVTAMTRPQLREFISNGIDAVNDDLRKRGATLIGDGFVKSAS